MTGGVTLLLFSLELLSLQHYVAAFFLSSGTRHRRASVSSASLDFFSEKSFNRTLRRPLRVGLLVEPTPFTHVSGYANRFNEMLKNLRKSGDEVEVVTPDNEEHNAAPKVVHGHRINNLRGFKFPMYPLITLTLDLKMRALTIMNRFRPDILHVATPSFLCFCGIIASRILSVPLVLSYHTHLPVYARNYGNTSSLWRFMGPDFSEWLSWKVIRMAHSNADLTLVTSPQMKEELESNGVQRVAVWRKGIDTVRFHPRFKKKEVREKLSSGSPDSPLLVYVGRLGREKRLTDLRAVLDANPTCRLAIVGKAAEDSYMAKLRESLEPTGRIVFTGQLGGDDLSEAFAAADAFVMPSDSETLGFVVLEAMASGVPCVCVKAGGLVDLVDDGETGFLVPVNDPAAFSSAVQKLVSNSSLRQTMARKARAEAERWDWESSTEHLRNVNYVTALRNFHMRANPAQLLFGWGRDKAAKVWKQFAAQTVSFWTAHPSAV